jgi:hypothetical protein
MILYDGIQDLGQVPEYNIIGGPKNRDHYLGHVGTATFTCQHSLILEILLATYDVATAGGYYKVAQMVATVILYFYYLEFYIMIRI